MGKIINIDPQNPSHEALKQVVHVLSQQGVVIVPTDSVYGIGCSATKNNPARERIFEIKNRPLDMTLPWLIADEQDMDRYGKHIPDFAHDLAKRFWPGALTLIVEASVEVAPEYQHSLSKTIALRVPDSCLVRRLIRMLSYPLATTSANIHGDPSATSGANLAQSLIEKADLTLDGGSVPLAIASTIVDCTKEKPQIIRAGALSAAEILEELKI